MAAAHRSTLSGKPQQQLEKQLLVLSECLHAGLPAYGVHGVAGWSAGTLLMLMLMLSTSNSAHPQIASGSSSVNWMPPCCHCLGTANPTGGYLAADGGVRERQLNFSSAVCSGGLHCLELREHTKFLDSCPHSSDIFSSIHTVSKVYAVSCSWTGFRGL